MSGVDIDDLTLIADKLSKDFTFYRNKKIFVTGGTGFFGKWLLESFIFLNNNHALNVTLTILSRSPEIFAKDYPHLANHDHFTFIQGDVRDLSDINTRYDLIIHAATDASSELNKSEPELMRSTIMDGAQAICDLAKRVNCHRILYTSSGAAYGPQPDNMTNMSETFVNNPLFNHNDAYASAKLESEQYFQKHTSCEVMIARCFAFAGPYLPLCGNYAFGNFIQDEMNHRDIVIKGDGSAIRSYLYAADLVVWLLRILSSGVDRDIYNVGSNHAISIKELAKKISSDTIKVMGKSEQNKNVYLPSVEKALSELGLQENYTIAQMVHKTKLFNK